MRMTQRKWLCDEVDRLKEMVGQYSLGRVPWVLVGRALGRTAESVAGKWGHLTGRKETCPPAAREYSSGGFRISDDLLAERDRRACLEARDLTSSLMGDPLPGYSAFDRRGGASL